MPKRKHNAVIPETLCRIMLDASGRAALAGVRWQRQRAATLAMLSALQAPKGALVVMDRGIATRISTWLAAQGYRYLGEPRAQAHL